MAALLIEHLSALANAASVRGKSDLACRAPKVAAALAVIDAERAKPPDQSPASHIKSAPN